MNKIVSISIFLLLISRGYSLAGFGLNLNQTMFDVDEKTNSIGTIGRYGSEEISGGNGLGGYLYIDTIPFIDIDLEFSGFGTTYNYSVTIDQTTTSYSLPFGSLAGYLTMQKKIFQLKIPLIAKTKFTAGAGINHQIYKSVPNQSDLGTLGITSSSSSPLPLTEKELITFVKDNTDSITGFHIQTGVQFKLLMLDSFLYYRYVFADDMIPGIKGFGSLNFRLGMGF